MSEMIRINGFIHSSVIDGVGNRLVYLVQGCSKKCLGCFNQECLDFNQGHSRSIDEIFYLINRQATQTWYSGFTLSGGEPFCQPLECAILAEEAHNCGWDVWTYSGYTYEELIELAETDENVDRLLKATDVLVDGPFIEELKDDNLKYRGSSNERIIALENGRWKELLNYDEEV